VTKDVEISGSDSYILSYFCLQTRNSMQDILGSNFSTKNNSTGGKSEES